MSETDQRLLGDPLGVALGIAIGNLQDGFLANQTIRERRWAPSGFNGDQITQEAEAAGVGPIYLWNPETEVLQVCHPDRLAPITWELKVPVPAPNPFEIARTRAYLEAWRDARATNQRGVKDPKAIIYMGKAMYRAGDCDPVRVDFKEDNVLQAFLGTPAMNKPDLVKASGEDDPGRVLRSLKTKYKGVFSDAIHLPGGKGKGGYRVRIATE